MLKAESPQAYCGYTIARICNKHFWPNRGPCFKHQGPCTGGIKLWPVDTSDMVNLLTGDMTYNIPLLEVARSGRRLSAFIILSCRYNNRMRMPRGVDSDGLYTPVLFRGDVNGYRNDYTQVKQTRP